MKHELIQREKYLLIVDDSEIKVDDWYLRYNKSLMRCTELKLSFNEALNKEETIIKSKGCGDPYERSKDYIKKIIAHLPLNNSPVLEGVDLLPPIEDDVEKLADEIYPETYYSGLYVDGWLKAGFIKGYNKAKEKYKYTDEDLIGVFNFLSFSKKSYSEFKDFIQSLQQTKMPVGFECGMEMCENNDVVFEDGSFNKPPYRLEKKKIKNLQGQTVWVGKYIFND